MAFVAIGTAVIGAAGTLIGNAQTKKAQANQIQAQTDRINTDAKLDVLTNAQKQQLAEEMAAATTESARQALLANAETSLNTSTISAIASVDSAKLQSSNTTLIIVVAGSIVALGVTAFIISRFSSK